MGHLQTSTRIIRTWDGGPRIFSIHPTPPELHFVPQHSIPGWITTGLLLGKTGVSPFKISACTVILRRHGHPSSPSGSFSMALPLDFIEKRWKDLRELAKSALFIPLLLVWKHSSSRAIISRSHVASIPVLGPLGVLLPRYLLFLRLEGGLVAVFCYRAVFPLHGGPAAFFRSCCALLFLIPSIIVGKGNDFAMRVSISAVFMLWAFACRAVFRPLREWRLAHFLLAITLAIGAMDACMEYLPTFNESSSSCTLRT